VDKYSRRSEDMVKYYCTSLKVADRINVFAREESEDNLEHRDARLLSAERSPSALSPTPLQTPHPYEPLPFMSHTQPTVSSSSNFQLIINNALGKYKKRTKTDLLTHPLAAQLQSCNSPNDILAVFQRGVQALDQSRNSDERWSRWLDPTVNVLYTLSSTLSAGVGLVYLKTYV
jgi:hypothetical protein